MPRFGCISFLEILEVDTHTVSVWKLSNGLALHCLQTTLIFFLGLVVSFFYCPKKSLVKYERIVNVNLCDNLTTNEIVD